jgi:hypothetical protein
VYIRQRVNLEIVNVISNIHIIQKLHFNLSNIQTWFFISFSLIVQHANCNVLVLKGDWKPAEDHGPELKEIVLAEEKERERRMHEPLESTLKHKKQELEAELLQKIESFHVTGVQPAEVSST